MYENTGGEFWEVGGAYGRRYTSARDMRMDWDQGLDFRVLSGPTRSTYCSSRDWPRGQANGDSVIGRYGADENRLTTLVAMHGTAGSSRR